MNKELHSVKNNGDSNKSLTLTSRGTKVGAAALVVVAGGAGYGIGHKVGGQEQLNTTSKSTISCEATVKGGSSSWDTLSTLNQANGSKLDMNVVMSEVQKVDSDIDLSKTQEGDKLPIPESIEQLCSSIALPDLGK